ncbi:hypothetical protein BGZ82_006568 [Podila clonocystis]|nr:hypothetical protein BGZ82_006568 [Podila clonocystis]
MSYVRHFNPQDQNGLSVLADLVSHNEMEPQLKSYVEEQKLAEMYATWGLQLNVDWRSRSDYKENPNMVNYLKLDINRQATWALCSPILEQLQTIVIPCDFSDMLSVEDGLNKLSMVKAKRRQNLESAVKFVQIHMGMFCTIKQVLCPTDRSSWGHNDQSCPEEYLDCMLECLPTLIDPTDLDNNNWKQFVSHPEQTNLEFVSKIDVWDQEALKYYQQVKSKPFLHRCSSLREYNMISLGQDSFKWAVQKKIAYDQEQDQGIQLTTRFLPLEVVTIRPKGEHFGSEIDDIGLSFGVTMKSFVVQRNSWRLEQTPHEQTPRQTLVIGRGWKMPLLTKLELTFSFNKVVLDPDFLLHCPSLQRLCLADELQEYNLSEIQLSRSAQLPELTVLALAGSGALSFHPDTLYSTKELKILCLGSTPGQIVTVLPSLEHMDPDFHQQDSTLEDSSTDGPTIYRPKWTWDWHLCNLRKLRLTFEFASHFQFQMLRGTPNLYELGLSLYSPGQQVERVLTKDDFEISCLQDNDEDSGREGTDPPTPSSSTLKDPSNTHELLRGQTTHTLDRIHWHLTSVGNTPYRRERVHGQITDLGLDELRGHVMFWEWPLEEVEAFILSADDSSSKDNASEEVAKAVRDIEELVGNEAHLQSELEVVLAQMQVWQARQREEKEGLTRYRAEHPDHLAAPSVKRLEIYGRWIISDEVLETMLACVFCNLTTLRECLTTGYSTDALVRVTQSMPWLSLVHIVDRYDPSSVSEENKLRPCWEYQRTPPFMNDAVTRVFYQFATFPSYSRAGSGSETEAETEETSEE